MRIAMIVTALVTLSACGGEPDATGPERGSAAGEVLGGEVTDDMLPLDTVKSTSPADPDAGTSDPADDANPAEPVDRNPGPLPSPEVSGGPDGRQSAGIEPTAEPPTE